MMEAGQKWHPWSSFPSEMRKPENSNELSVDQGFSN